jgi:FkbM family methyltransferase
MQSHIAGHETIEARFSRLKTAARKLLWGLDEVGLQATAQGAVRLASMHLRRSPRAEIRLGSGLVLEFDYRSQFPTMLVMFGDFVDPEFAFLRAVARPDWVVADVGAAIGQFTLFAARLPCARVHAFEPSSANVATLRRNVARNGVADRVRVHQIAFSNVNEECFFETTASAWFSHLGGADAPGAERVEVRTASGEFQRQKLDHVNVLKINVAGFEPSVIEGAMAFLVAGGADILILLLGLASLPWYAKIAECGYRFFYYHPVARTLFEVTAYDPSSVLDHRPSPARNIIAIHGDAIARGVISSIAIRGADGGPAAVEVS